MPTLVKKAAYRTATAPIDLAIHPSTSTIAVTDLMKSLSLIQYTPGSSGLPDTLTETARHFETLWGTACAHVGENTYLESDAEGNLVVLDHDVQGFSEEDRRRLKVTSEMLLGEMVNRIRPIPSTLSPTPNATILPRAFLATVEGGVYLFALIAPSKQNLLITLQSRLVELVKSPGDVTFGRYRGFKTQVRDMGEEGPVRFVDGEVVEKFLDLTPEMQGEVCRDLPGLSQGAHGVEEVRGLVEGLRRVR